MLHVLVLVSGLLDLETAFLIGSESTAFCFVGNSTIRDERVGIDEEDDEAPVICATKRASASVVVVLTFFSFPAAPVRGTDSFVTIWAAVIEY